MWCKVSIGSWALVAVLLAVVVSQVPREAGAGPLALSAVIAAQDYLETDLPRQLAAMRRGEWEERTAAEVRESLSVSRQAFVETIRQIDAEIERLKVNLDETNRQRIAELQEAKAQAGDVQTRLVVLNKLMNDRKTAISALRSGHLERTLNEVVEYCQGFAKTAEAIDAELRTTAVDRPALVNFRHINVHSGEIRFFLADARDERAPQEGWGEKEVHLGRDYRIRTSPVRIRACIMDSQKKRLFDQQNQEHRFLTFEKVTGGVPLQTFKYWMLDGGNQARRESVWTTKEQYTWTVGPPSTGTAQKLQGMRQSNSSVLATRDILALYPKEGTAQNLHFDITARCVGWTLKMTYEGSTRVIEWPPEKLRDAEAKASIVLSIFGEQ